MYNHSSRKTLLCDRFISSRQNIEQSINNELLNEIIEKKEKFASENMEIDDLSNPPDELNNSQKGYCSLLQNQILGINDQYTISQLVGSSYLYKGYPYDQKFSLFQRNGSKIDVDKENLGYQLPACCGFHEDDHKLLLPIKEERKISSIPFKVLDAPALQDDFYLNVVDWSSQGILAVGLGSCV